jgi:hypothetical protein
MENILSKLKEQWIFIVAIFAAGAAYSEGISKIKNLEQAVQSNAEVSQKIHEVEKNQSRLDERTISIQNAQERQEELLNMILEQTKNHADNRNKHK